VAPFSKLVARLWQQGSKKGFALANPPPDKVIFRAGDYIAVRLERGD
jgi:hypothetical protein